MTKIRIQSNPYEKKIKYSRYDENKDDYIPVEDDSTSSVLLSDAYVNCYFLSKAQNIVNQIIDEYGADLEIVFDGVTEEFEGLQELIKTDKVYETIKITKGAESLEDPQNVIKQFQDISKVINDIADNCDVVDNDNLCSLNMVSAKSSCNNTVYKEIKQLHSRLENKASFTKKAVERKTEDITIEISEKESLFKDRKQILISELETIIEETKSAYLQRLSGTNNPSFDRMRSIVSLVFVHSIPSLRANPFAFYSYFQNVVNYYIDRLQGVINGESKNYWEVMSDDLIYILISTVTRKKNIVDTKDFITVSKAEYYEIKVDTSLTAKDLFVLLEPLGFLNKKIQEMYLPIYEGHSKIFEKWAKNDLLNAVISKIDTLNPYLELNKEETQSLIERKKQLEQYLGELDEQIQRIANIFSFKK